MKRYLLFVYDYGEPKGGLHDLVGSFDKYQEAVDELYKYADKAPNGITYHILDTKTGRKYKS